MSRHGGLDEILDSIVSGKLGAIVADSHVRMLGPTARQMIDVHYRQITPPPGFPSRVFLRRDLASAAPD